MSQGHKEVRDEDRRDTERDCGGEAPQGRNALTLLAGVHVGGELDVVGWEEAHVPAGLTLPPVGVLLVEHVDELPFAEGQLVVVLRCVVVHADHLAYCGGRVEVSSQVGHGQEGPHPTLRVSVGLQRELGREGRWWLQWAVVVDHMGCWGRQMLSLLFYGSSPASSHPSPSF